MNYRRILFAAMIGCFGVVVVTAISKAQPQIPGAPAVPAAPAKGNLLSMLLPTKEQRQNAKDCFCNSGIGKLFSGMMAPLGAATGGLMVNRCEKNAIANDLKNKAADEPAGAAARIKADEAEAKARREAVRFLGTVDCNYWPEAIDALKTALRKDRNECVRFEAALALQSGCCCNNEIIDALTNAVLGENKTDPHPPERSERVRAAAAEALARCPIKEAPKIDEKKLTSNQNVTPADYYKKVAAMPRGEVTAQARAVLVSLQQQQNGKSATPPTTETGVAAPVVAPLASRPSSISGIFTNAFAPGAATRTSPFFANLTRTLTGSQDTSMPMQRDTIQPMNTGSPQPRDPAAWTPAELPRPNPLTDLPRDNPLSPKTSTEPRPLFDVPTESPQTPKAFPEPNRTLPEAPRPISTPVRPLAAPEIISETPPLSPMPPAPMPAAPTPPVEAPKAPEKTLQWKESTEKNVSLSPFDSGPLTIEITGPKSITVGGEAIFEVRVLNRSPHMVSGVTLFGWLPDALSHAAGQEIKGEVKVAIAPGEFATLRLPTHAVKAGPGALRVKIAANVGEASATTEIEVAQPAWSAPTQPKLDFARPTITNETPAIPSKTSAAPQIIQTNHRGAVPMPPTGSLGTATISESSTPGRSSIGPAIVQPER